jgi:hypothetical protein
MSPPPKRKIEIKFKWSAMRILYGVRMDPFFIYRHTVTFVTSLTAQEFDKIEKHFEKIIDKICALHHNWSSP